MSEIGQIMDIGLTNDNLKRCAYVWPNGDLCDGVSTQQLRVPRYMLDTDTPYPERVGVINAWLCHEHHGMIDGDKSWRHWLKEQ